MTRSTAAKKAWLSRARSGPNSALQKLEAQMAAQRADVLRRQVKGSDTTRARKIAADMKRSFKALGIQAVPWMKGIKVLAHNKGRKNYDMDRTGLPRANTWRPLPTVNPATRARIRALEAKIRKT